MPRPLRYHPSQWAPVFVTNRCFQSRMLLKPSSRLNQLVVGIIARALKMYEVKLYGLCMMSNHYHMLLAPKNAQHLASFMQYVDQNISTEIGRLHHWSRGLWNHRYRSSPVLDQEALLDRMKYIFANSVKEGLVRHPRYWPGVHCYQALADKRPLTGIWIDRTRWSQKRKLHESEVTTQYTLNFHKLPGLEHLNDYQYALQMKELSKHALSEWPAPEKVMGQKRVLAVDPHSRPKQSSQHPAPLCHTTCHEKRREFIAAFKAFVESYQEVFDQFRRTVLDVVFPHGGIPPIAWSARPEPSG